jgi:hypothetical protein
LGAKPKTADGADDEDDAANADQVSARKPAGTEFLRVKRAELPPEPTLAEKISSQKDFSHGIFDGGDPEFRRFTVKDYEVKEASIIASRSNFYLPFPMLDLGVAPLKRLGFFCSFSPKSKERFS